MTTCYIAYFTICDLPQIYSQFSAFTMDVIARCVFGMTIDNIGENDDPFVAKAKDMFNFPASKSPAILLAREFF